MELSLTLKQEITDFLISLPIIHDSDSQRAFIYHAGLDSQLQEQIPFGKPLIEFVPLLISVSLSYGKLNNGRYAIEAILEATQHYIGHDRKAYCTQLLQQVHQDLLQCPAEEKKRANEVESVSKKERASMSTEQRQHITKQGTDSEKQFPATSAINGQKGTTDFSKKIAHIERLLNKEEYTDSATRCVIIIDQTLRHVVAQHLETVDDETKREVQEAVQKRDRRGGGIHSLTMGEVVHVIRETKFFDAWARAKGKDLSSLRIIDLDKLTELRNKFARQNQDASSDEAKLLLQCLKIILAIFEVEYDEMISPIVTDTPQGKEPPQRLSPHSLKDTLKMILVVVGIALCVELSYLGWQWLHPQVQSSSGQNITGIVSTISTPLALSGFLAAAFFFTLKQIVAKNIFPKLTKRLSSDILKLIINRLFLLALIAMLLGFIGYIIPMLMNSFSLEQNNVENAPNDAENTVYDLHTEITALEGTRETIDSYGEHVAREVREKAPKLASRLSNIDDQLLGLDYQILKYRALCIALTTAASVEINQNEKRQYADQAILAEEKGQVLIDKAVRQATSGNQDDQKLLQWIDEGSMKDHLHMLRAIAFAVKLQTGDEAAFQEVRKQLDELPTTFKEKYPPEGDPVLTWFLDQEQARPQLPNK